MGHNQKKSGSASSGKPLVKLTALDRAVSFFSPKAGLERVRARAAMTYLEGSGYITSSSYKRSMRGWNPASGSADDDTLPKLEASRRDSRDLCMNSPLAVAPLRRQLTSVVGWGLTMQSRIDREYLKMDDDEADKWERNTEREFALWAESQLCDASKSQTFYELQSLVFYNTLLSGDVFVVLPFIKKNNTPYSLTLKVVESDYVSNPNMSMDNNSIAGGIKVDKNGAPEIYYFRKSLTPFILPGPSPSDKWTPVDVFGRRTGRRNVLHLYHKLRPGQRRGMPELAPVVELLKQMSRLTEAELMASVIASFFTVFIKTNPLTGGLAEGFTPAEKVTDEDVNAADENVYEMGSGSIIELGEDGQDISIADPKRPNDSFEPFFLAMVKQLGAALGVPYEELILHFSSSYSASRAALQEAWKFYRERRVWLARSFCIPVYQEWLSEAVSIGRISAPGFYDDPSIAKAWGGSAWEGPGQGQIDPLKETKAADMRIQRLLSTHQDEYTAIHGGDWESSLNRSARERNKIKEKDLVYPVPQSNSSNEVVDGIEENNSD